MRSTGRTRAGDVQCAADPTAGGGRAPLPAAGEKRRRLSLELRPPIVADRGIVRPEVADELDLLLSTGGSTRAPRRTARGALPHDRRAAGAPGGAARPHRCGPAR